MDSAGTAGWEALDTPGGEIPAALLDDQRAAAGDEALLPLAATALRTRAVAARHLLAREVGPTPLDTLLAIARSGPPYDADVPLAGARQVANLARVVALQEVRPSDQADGLALLDLALARFGPGRIPPARQALHAQLACVLGHRDRAQALCAVYPAIAEHVRTMVTMDATNPYAVPESSNPAGAEAWRRAFASFFPRPAPSVAPLGDLGDPAEGASDGRPPFDRIAVDGVAPVEAPELITVVVTCYRPDPTLLTAVRSLLAQSWPHLEVLVVDDASGDAWTPVLAECAALDPRVRLVRLAHNGGTYRARNVGLDEAAGTLVTFQDADDWSHPHRLAVQAHLLRSDDSVLATTSYALRTTADLCAVLPGQEAYGPNRSSLMVRRRPVVARIGYFDSVRKAADTEYLHRIAAVFGDHAVAHATTGAYALVRRSAGSLSGSDFAGGGWMHPGRAAYRAAYTRWHARIRTGHEVGYVASEPDPRPFPAPAYIRGAAPGGSARSGVAAGGDAEYDVVLVADWRWPGAVQRSARLEAAALAAHGMRVGIVALESFRRPKRERTWLHSEIAELVHRGTVDEVLLEEAVAARLVLVRYPSVLQFPPETVSRLRARRLVLVAGQAPSEDDSTDQRYDPRWCEAVARQLFSAEPTWVAHTPAVRQRLHVSGAGTVDPDDLPTVVDTAGLALPRRGACDARPVLGRYAEPRRGAWPAERDALLACLPDSDATDVRLWGDPAPARALLGGDVPPRWCVYSTEATDQRSFLHQLDFYVYFPHPASAEPHAYPVVEACAAGVVAVLPEQLAPVFGQAAVYCTEQEVGDVVKAYHGDPERYRQQATAASVMVRQRHGHAAYVARLAPLLDGDAALTGSSTVPEGR